MISIKKILFPTDFSECAEHALKYAISLATAYDAKLYVLHVITELNIPVGLGVSTYPLSEIYDAMEKEAQKKMQRLIPAQLQEKGKVENIIIRGTPFLEIIKTARKYDIDLITIATHGRTGLSHVFLGSTAEKVVRQAPCPVLCVKHPEHEFVVP
ncbi:MAG: universal stress protein [Candidatus Brocadia sp.]|jgi:nucleotide-binding universal stress UspA family protein